MIKLDDDNGRMMKDGISERFFKKRILFFPLTVGFPEKPTVGAVFTNYKTI